MADQCLFEVALRILVFQIEEFQDERVFTSPNNKGDWLRVFEVPVPFLVSTF
jgi:hypothetical protein